MNRQHRSVSRLANAIGIFTCDPQAFSAKQLVVGLLAFSCLAISFFTATLLTSSQTADAAEMQVRRDLPYAKTENPRQTLDVYLPAKPEKAPILVWIHGGGWRAGNKSLVQNKPQAFVDQGFIFVSVNYRLRPAAEMDAIAGDIATAIAWIHERAAKHGGDPETIFVAGHSAGAHLAALVCTDDTYLKQADLSLDNIEGCIPVDTAAYDIVKLVENRGRLRSALHRSAFGDTAESQKKYSPLTYVKANKTLPPFLLLHVASREDSSRQSREFAKAIVAAGGQAEVVSAENKTHGTINSELGTKGDKPTAAVYAFLREHQAKTER